MMIQFLCILGHDEQFDGSTTHSHDTTTYATNAATTIYASGNYYF